jgi:TonB family protein
VACVQIVGLAAALLGLFQTSREPEPTPTAVEDVAVVAPFQYGTVELECTIQRRGRIGDCDILSETPVGRGFGRAALNTARRARLPRETYEGQEGEKVRLVNRFVLRD